jgi:hypothetical protein
VEISSPCFSNIVALHFSYKRKQKMKLKLNFFIKKIDELKKNYNECLISAIYEFFHQFPHIHPPYLYESPHITPSV